MGYICRECGRESPKWLGRCPGCGAWNTLEEREASSTAQAVELASLSLPSTPRLPTPYQELNRVLGGGIVPGSLILIGGEPGIGKSTLLLQVADGVARVGGRVAYVSAEESPHQIKLRAERLGVEGKGLFLLAETSLSAILTSLETLSPSLVVLDSIQAVYLEEGSAPGTLSQVRESTLRLMGWAKPRSIPIFITGHVTKEGNLAGPKALEHIVDVVLYLEGETYGSYRLLRGVKNRFGSTQEIGVFEMGGRGLGEVDNPSRLFLSPHLGEAVGCAVVPTLEGSRVLLVEVQALTSQAYLGPPRRLATGVDFSRLLLLSAVLSKRAGLPLSSQDIIVNAAGGYSIREPAADLAIALAIASSLKEAPLAQDMVAVGEVGLTGELRPVVGMERRLLEACRLGFRRCLAPPGDAPHPPGMEFTPVSTLSQALRAALPRRKEQRGTEAGKTALPA